MGSIKVYLDDELEERFRELAMRLYGYGRGSLSIAAENALELWLAQVSEVIDVVETIDVQLRLYMGCSSM